MRGGYLRRSRRESCHAHRALPARFSEQYVRMRASVRAFHSSLNVECGCGVEIGVGRPPAYAPRDSSVSSSRTRRRDDSLTISSWRMRTWRRRFSSSSLSGVLRREDCIGAGVEEGEMIIAAAPEGGVEFCWPRSCEYAYWSEKPETSPGDVSGEAYMPMPVYWENDAKAPEGLAELTCPRYAMLGSSGAPMKAPDIEVAVGEGVHEASPEGGVTDVRGWTPIWASPIAPDRLDVELE